MWKEFPNGRRGLVVLSSGHPKGLGVDVPSVLLTMMTAACKPQEGRRGHLSPRTLISQCLGTNQRINRKSFRLKMMSGWKPPDAASPSILLLTLMDENALGKLPPSLQTLLLHNVKYALDQDCH